MCNVACVVFGAKSIAPEEVRGKRVIEVGAYDVNGTLRPILEAWGPAAYVGVDLMPGPGVDEVCEAEQLVERFGPESFDLVVSTEMVEHVRDWRRVFSNLKRICRPDGLVVITTRSPGYPYHAYPHDFWRYSLDDMKAIFADFDLLALESDPTYPGVFLMARKPRHFQEADLSGLALVSVVTNRRQKDLADGDFLNPHFYVSVAKDRLKTVVLGMGKTLLHKT
jgi:SAM-dependent methyltransferase